jgi:hypothetical protein
VGKLVTVDTVVASQVWAIPDLNAEELDVIRGLQEGAQLAEADGPIWDSLEDLGLVEARETTSSSDMAPARIPTLTLAGVDYPTG